MKKAYLSNAAIIELRQIKEAGFVMGPTIPKKKINVSTLLAMEKTGLIEINDARFQNAEIKEYNVEICNLDGKYICQGLEYKGNIYISKYFSGCFYPFIFRVANQYAI